MRPGLLLAATAILTLAGCGSVPSSVPAPHAAATASTLPPTSSGPPASTSANAASPTPAAGPDVSECVTGNCTVQVIPGTQIMFQPGLGIDSLRVVSIDQRQVTVRAQSTTDLSGGGSFMVGIACSAESDSGVITDELGVNCWVTNMRLRLAVDAIANGNGYSATLVIDHAPCEASCPLVGPGDPQ